MKVLVTGANGMLGSEVVKQTKEKGWEVIVSDLKQLDITNENSVSSYVKENKPEVIINCAAYTNVDGCEDEPELCNKTNGNAVGYLAKASNENNSLFVHISTDQVFGENKENGYNEDHSPYSPLNQYGKSKQLGEEELLANTNNYYLIRTEWLFGKGATNFISKMLELGEKLDLLKVVTDEIGKPTYTKDLTAMIIRLIEEKVKPGIYHGVSEGSCSRYEFAKEVFKHSGTDIKVEKTTLSEFKRKVKVPNISILNNTKLPKLKSWQEMVEDYLSRD